MNKKRGFRSPCFTTKGSTNNHYNTNSNNGVDHLSQILEYTKSYDQNEKLLSFQNEGDADDSSCLSSLDERNDVALETQNKSSTVAATIEVTNHQSKISNPNSEDSHMEMSQEKSIKMLEPHLIGFRKILTEDGCNIDNSNVSGDGDGDTDKDNGNFDLASKIPLSLIRVARFFPFKWIPIKKALIRPPLPSEVNS